MSAVLSTDDNSSMDGHIANLLEQLDRAEYNKAPLPSGLTPLVTSLPPPPSYAPPTADPDSTPRRADLLSFRWELSPSTICTPKPSGSDVRLPLGDGKYLTSSMFMDSQRIHLRKFSTTYATKDGVSFTVKRYASFLRHADEIDEQVEKMQAVELID